MLCRRISHITVPAVLRILLGYFSHEIVTVCFGKDACRSNAGICGVSVNHGLEILEAVAAERAEFIAVNEEEIRLRIQPLNGPLHTCNGCPEDIELIYLLGRYCLNGPCNCLLLNDWPQLLASLFRHLFGVV